MGFIRSAMFEMLLDFDLRFTSVGGADTGPIGTNIKFVRQFLASTRYQI